ncbi:MAG TPA: hypothetical protein QGF58_28465 [Myxococcota bacterium]|nr:hypothetical protein [Myxococcota bacterium]
MKRITPLAALAILVGCSDLEQEEVLTLDAMDQSLTKALDDQEAEEPVLMDLDVEELDNSELDDEDTRRENIRRALRRLAEDEPCAIRGVVAGRYQPAELEDADGVFAGRAFRKDQELVAKGAGTYAGEGGFGEFDGEYVNFERDTGIVSGRYGHIHDDERMLGLFDGEWDPTDETIEGGNMRGVWHPLKEASGGMFVGYYSRCDLDPRHLEESNASE